MCEACLAVQRERNRQRYYKCKAEGLCLTCKKPVDRRGVRCQECIRHWTETYKTAKRERSRVYQQERNVKLKAAGLCISCAKPSGKNALRCPKCLRKNLAKNKRKYQERKKLGLCPKCGKRPDRPDRRYCESCRARNRFAYTANRRNKTLAVTYRGVTLSPYAWDVRLGLSPGVVSRRLRQGWALDEVLSPERRKTPKAPVVPMEGKQFGKWSVLSYQGDSNWLCRCACGRERSINGGNLRSGRTKSCAYCHLATARPCRYRNSLGTA